MSKPKKPKSSKAAPSAPRRKVDIELAKKRLVELHGYKEDELEVLFKDDAGIIAAYVAIKNDLSQSDKSLAADATAEEDDFKLPGDDLERLNSEEAADKQGSQAVSAGEVADSDPTGTLKPDDIATVQKDLDDLLATDLEADDEPAKTEPEKNDGAKPKINLEDIDLSKD